MKVASDAHLESDRFEPCRKRLGPARVAADVAEGRRLRVSGTPTFFVGERHGQKVYLFARLSGAASLEHFRRPSLKHWNVLEILRRLEAWPDDPAFRGDDLLSRYP